MELLTILFKSHNTWIKYIVSFGCNKELAEDFVQEMYIKIWYDELSKEINTQTSYKIQSHLCYIKFVFDKVFIEHNSVSELSRSSGITYWSLRNTIVQIKNQIKEL